MKRLGLFLDEFGFDIGVVCIDRWMVTVRIPCWNLGGWCREVTLEWNAFRADAKRTG